MSDKYHDFAGKFLCWGPPGTGKTTWAAQKVGELLSMAPVRPDGSSPVSVCSLTKTAATELASRDAMRLPSRQIGTLHSLAYKALGAPEVTESHIKDWNKEAPELQISDTRPAELDDMNGDEMPVMKTSGDARYQEYHQYRAKMVDRSMWRPTVLDFAKYFEAWKSANGLLDFTDLIERCIEDVPCAPGTPDIIIADEAQDLSRLEQTLISKWASRCQAQILIGDPYQALFCWRGADPHYLFEGLPDSPEHRRLLSRSYRVPEKVRQVAMKIIQRVSGYMPIEYKARPVNKKEVNGPVEEGEVICSENMSLKSPGKIVEAIAADLEAGMTVMVETTCGYMLNGVLAELRKVGIPFANPWRKKNGVWNPIRSSGKRISARDRLMHILAPHKGVARAEGEDPPHMWTAREFNSFASLLMSDHTFIRGGKTKMASLAKSNPECEMSIGLLLEIMEPEFVTKLLELPDIASPVGMVEFMYQKMLTDKRGALDFPIAIAKRGGFDHLMDKPKTFVGTIHSFKGSEADSVYLFPDLSPSAVKGSHTQHGRDELARAFYVGVTRARTKLTICRGSSRAAVNLRRYC